MRINQRHHCLRTRLWHTPFFLLRSVFFTVTPNSRGELRYAQVASRCSERGYVARRVAAVQNVPCASKLGEDRPDIICAGYAQKSKDVCAVTSTNEVTIAGVFDGHGGLRAAERCKYELVPALLEVACSKSAAIDAAAIVEKFWDMDARVGSIKNIVRKVPRSQIEVRNESHYGAIMMSQPKNLWNQTAEAACRCGLSLPRHEVS